MSRILTARNLFIRSLSTILVHCSHTHIFVSHPVPTFVFSRVPVFTCIFYWLFRYFTDVSCVSHLATTITAISVPRVFPLPRCIVSSSLHFRAPRRKLRNTNICPSPYAGYSYAVAAGLCARWVLCFKLALRINLLLQDLISLWKEAFFLLHKAHFTGGLSGSVWHFKCRQLWQNAVWD